ncbi:MAG: ADP-glyceromanno-heptose 6-epimerase [Candidatus Omnitrophica bacterium]|nr:ADP-glyceromanno-heptose 6-epimerase [Candidatus Omnitrophota bacterium]MCF7893913.1 ADP-glyceromanno-heptose 6-epimerase [Candidatus Omnitrophota bacterium]
MRVLVTGAAGFIGSNVVNYLESKSIDTVAFDNFSHSDYRNLLNTNAEIICGDVTDKDFSKNIPKVDAVIHEAAITDTTLADDAKMVRVNYNGFRNIFDFSVEKKIPLVYASSAGVYGKAEKKMSEEQEVTPHNTYAYSKYLCDCWVNKYLQKNKTPPIVGLRYFNVYGPGEAHKKKAASMIFQLYNQMIENKNPRIFKFGQQKRDFIYVKDVARITADAINLDRSVISNVGTGEPRTFKDIISILNKLLKTELKPEYIDNPYSEVYQNYTEADSSKLTKILKTEADYSLEEGIKDYLENYLKK